VLSTAIWETVIASKERDLTNSLYDNTRKFLNEIRNKADKDQSIKLTTEIIEHLSQERTRISEELKVAKSILDVYQTGKIPNRKKKKVIIKRRRI
jgi:Ca2+-binding EF-hand superfamily protein